MLSSDGLVVVHTVMQFSHSTHEWQSAVDLQLHGY